MLDTNNTVPLYQQLKEIIKNAIISHEYKYGEQLPTEIEIAQKYGVSRITVRKAITELSEEGMLIKKQGKGTFVQQKRIHRKMDHLLSFTKACTSNGMIPSTKMIDQAFVQIDQSLADMFSLTAGERMLMIQRLRKADGVPVMLEQNYFPAERFGWLMDEDLTGSLYELLKAKRHIVVSASRDSYLDVVKADARMSKILEIGCGEPLFCMQTKIYDREDQLVHVGIEYIVCERYRFSLVDHYADDE